MIFVPVSAVAMMVRSFLLIVVFLVCGGLAQDMIQKGNPWALACIAGGLLSLFLACRSFRNALRVAAAWWTVNFGNK